MDIAFSTPLKGNLVLCRDLRDAELTRRPDLYKFLWVRQGALSLEVDHVPMRLEAGEIVSLTPLHHVGSLRADGDCLSLLFDSNFYCIFGHDGEVSCNGLLFNGSSEPLRLALSAQRQEVLGRIVDELCAEYEVNDGLREEMLRMQLKRFIIVCTRAAREHFGADGRRNSCSTSCGGFTCLSTSISAPAAACRTTPNCCTARPRPFPTSSPPVAALRP